MPHTLPPLPYDYDALEPHIDAQTMQLHHDIHHNGYVKGLNAAEEKLRQGRENADYSAVKSAVQAMAFHGSGHYLHTLFWQCMGPAGNTPPMSDELRQQIEKDFGSLDAFEAEFKAAGKTVEGSGWVILGWNGEQLAVYQHLNHQHADVAGYTPMLVCDVWEHAYYLKYQNKRGEYLSGFWTVINWGYVSQRFASV